MTNVNHRSAFIPAEMLIRAHSTVTTVLQPPWLRARGTFFCVVDNTALNVIRFTPPLAKQPLTSVTLGVKASWGDISAPRPGQNIPVLNASPMKYRPRSPRCARLCPRIAMPLGVQFGHPSKGLFALHTAFPPSHVIPHAVNSACFGIRTQQRCSGEYSIPTRDIKGQDSRGQMPTATLFFSENATPVALPICR